MNINEKSTVADSDPYHVLGVLDPDPVVRVMDPDPVLSIFIIKQKYLDSYRFVI